MKKIVSLLLVLSVIFCFFSCSKSQKVQQQDDGSIIIKSKEYKGVELGNPNTKLNPQEIYNKIEYTSEMLYGRYSIHNWFAEKQEIKEQALQEFSDSVGFTEDPYPQESEAAPKKISALPFAWNAGLESLDKGLVHETKYHWVNLHFSTEQNSHLEHQFAYEVKGDKIILTGVEWEWDNDSKHLEYKLLEDVKLEYSFKINGRVLTLSNQEKSVKLYSGLSFAGDYNNIFVDHYVTADSPIIEKFGKLSAQWDEKNDDYRLSVLYTDEKEIVHYSDDAIMQLTVDGLLTITYSIDGEVLTYQFVYILCEDDGIILFDNEKTYYLFDTPAEYLKLSVASNVDIDEMETVNALSDAQLEKISKTKSDLTADLTEAFKNAGIEVTVNTKTGELAMDATVLFGGDSAELTQEGKAFLDKFIKAYSTIITNEKYAEFISKTMVEGHIAPVAGTTYEGGLPLSTERAQNVLKYCLSSKEAVDAAKLENTMEAVGLSNSKPILDENGEADIAASRRVSFRFIINLESVK